jgi:hypothetical protein
MLAQKNYFLSMINSMYSMILSNCCFCQVKTPPDNLNEKSATLFKREPIFCSTTNKPWPVFELTPEYVVFILFFARGCWVAGMYLYKT